MIDINKGINSVGGVLQANERTNGEIQTLVGRLKKTAKMKVSRMVRIGQGVYESTICSYAFKYILKKNCLLFPTFLIKSSETIRFLSTIGGSYVCSGNPSNLEFPACGLEV